MKLKFKSMFFFWLSGLFFFPIEHVGFFSVAEASEFTAGASISGDLSEDDDGDDDAFSSDSGKDSDDSFDQKEIRLKFLNAFGAYAGEFMPWTLYGAQFLHAGSAKNAFAFYSGAGRFSRSSNQPLKNRYDVSADVVALGSSHRFYLSESMPLMILSTVSLGSMKGKLSPRSTEVDEADKNGSDFLSSTFKSYMATLSTGLALSYTWQNGIHAEWNIIAAQKTFAFGATVDRDGDNRSTEAKRFIEEPKLFGVINFAVSYFIH